jgi:isoquinoline 1-oxidoreductase alpha subunit
VAAARKRVQFKNSKPMKLSFKINNEPKTVDVPDNMPLLWVVRDVLGMKGTKFGCGQAMCGACTLHVNGEAVRSCSYAAKFAEGKNITTIEGLISGDKLHAVQQAWLDEKVPQCGYCQPGFIMATASLLEKIPTPTDEEINDNITNICRCGTYYRIRKAIHRAVELNKVNL